MSINIVTSTRQAAKEAGTLDQFFLRRKHVAVLFEPASQAAPVTSFILDLSSAWDGRTAPANAAGFLRSALSAEGRPSGFSKPTRILTEHKTTS